MVAGASSEDDLAKRGSFAWRGGEGSVTDREPNLIHMQARHYDPTLGRFLQADSLMLASFTTQGTNRYLYTENDPVNRSDPTGRFIPAFVCGILLGVAFLAGLIAGMYYADSFQGPQTIAQTLSQEFLGATAEVSFCYLVVPQASAAMEMWGIGSLLFGHGGMLLLAAFFAGLATGMLIGRHVDATEEVEGRWDKERFPEKIKPKLLDTYPIVFA